MQPQNFRGKQVFARFQPSMKCPSSACIRMPDDCTMINALWAWNTNLCVQEVIIRAWVLYRNALPEALMQSASTEWHAKFTLNPDPSLRFNYLPSPGTTIPIPNLDVYVCTRTLSASINYLKPEPFPRLLNPLTRTYGRAPAHQL